jgi:hypothetical protein
MEREGWREEVFSFFLSERVQGAHASVRVARLVCVRRKTSGMKEEKRTLFFGFFTFEERGSTRPAQQQNTHTHAKGNAPLSPIFVLF